VVETWFQRIRDGSCRPATVITEAGPIAAAIDGGDDLARGIVDRGRDVVQRIRHGLLAAGDVISEASPISAGIDGSDDFARGVINRGRDMFNGSVTATWRSRAS